MTTSLGAQIAESWTDPTFASNWKLNDGQDTLLALPRAMAPVVAGSDAPINTVLEIASGPGAFLAGFLTEFPGARGIATDASPAMLQLGRDGLKEFGERVEFKIVDMTELGSADLPTGIDAVITSRASHHMDAAGLAAFYGDAAALLRPGGWIFNLDHITLAAPWLRRMKDARKRFVPKRAETTKPTAATESTPTSDSSGHFHAGESPTVDEHLTALRGAGLDSQLVWQAFRTVMVVGHKTA